jgi:uncharacterized protein involved in response to NO
MATNHASIPAALRRRRDYAGPALFSYGFRPFFLGAAIWAALGILLWLPQYFGELTLPTAFGPLDWHIHEMIYGFVGAVIAGFLLTAIPNWTGRLPVNGLALAALAGLWVAGRAAIFTSAIIGEDLAAVIDIAFLAVLGAMAAREIIAGNNWRNLRVLILLLVLIAGNVMFHLEILWRGTADYGARIAIAAVVALIMLIGGRIVPSFTRNWLVRQNPGRLPQPFGRFDALALAGSVLALVAWIALPQHIVTGVLLLAGGVVQSVRLARWAGDRTSANRLVLVLHVAYAFVPLGFLLLGAAVLRPSYWSTSAALHAWTAGAFGLMTLGVMTRASLGHTGRDLVASIPTQLIFLAALIAALSRIAAAFAPSVLLFHIAAFAWIAAFAGFAAVYGPLLIRHPPNWAKG